MPALAAEETPSGLIDGAFAEWQTGGVGSLDPDGTSDLSTLVIFGAESIDLTVHAEIRARFGPYVIHLLDEIVSVPAGGESVLPIDMRPALSLHEKQTAYPTAFRGAVSVVTGEGARGVKQLIPVRFLATPAGAAAELYDSHDRLKETYELGITDDAERERARQALLQLPDEPTVHIAFGPGIGTSSPLIEDEQTPGGAQ